MNEKKLVGVILFGYLYLFQGIVMVISRYIKGHILALLIGLLTFCIGIGLLKLRELARKFAIYLNLFFIIYAYFILIIFKVRIIRDIISLLLFILVNIYFIFPIFYFTRLRVKGKFRQRF